MRDHCSGCMQDSPCYTAPLVRMFCNMQSLFNRVCCPEVIKCWQVQQWHHRASHFKNCASTVLEKSRTVCLAVFYTSLQCLQSINFSRDTAAECQQPFFLLKGTIRAAQMLPATMPSTLGDIVMRATYQIITNGRTARTCDNPSLKPGQHAFAMPEATGDSRWAYSDVLRSRKSLMKSVPSARKDSSTDAEKAASVSYSLYALSTYSVSVCVLPMMFPEITETAPNSPIALCIDTSISSPLLTTSIRLQIDRLDEECELQDAQAYKESSRNPSILVTTQCLWPCFTAPGIAQMVHYPQQHAYQCKHILPLRARLACCCMLLEGGDELHNC